MRRPLTCWVKNKLQQREVSTLECTNRYAAYNLFFISTLSTKGLIVCNNAKHLLTVAGSLLVEPLKSFVIYTLMSS